MKTQANTLFIGGLEYVIPAGFTDKEVNALCAMLLRFRRVDEVYSSDYKVRFAYQEQEYTAVRLNTRDLYTTEETARAARDAHNAALELGTDARARADDLSLTRESVHAIRAAALIATNNLTGSEGGGP